VGDVLLALHLFCEQLEQLLEVVVEILFKAVNHTVIVVLDNTVLDVLTLQQNPLLSPVYGIHQMGVVVKAIILEVVLVQDVLILAQEVVDLGLTIAFSASSVILSAGA
jgi:hypothetical protein